MSPVCSGIPYLDGFLGGFQRICMPKEEVVLRKGDSIFLEGQAMKQWRVESEGRCELIWVLS